MSGGELDYVYAKILVAKDDIYDFNYLEVHDGLPDIRHYPFRTEKHLAFLKQLEYFAEALRAIEWVMSGDTSPGDEIADVDVVLRKD